MELTYDSKKSKSEILKLTPKAILQKNFESSLSDNFLFKGDNLNVMQALLSDFHLRGKIDLVYIDPPFATNTVYRSGKHRTATISSSEKDAIAYTDHLVGEEYLEFLRERLFFIRELMSENASIYLHIDYKIGHYVKIIMDEVFGVENFRNDITRIKCNPKNFERKGYSNIKDLILFYSKSEKFIWNEPLVDQTEEQSQKLFNKVDANGRRYTTNPLHAPGETKNGKTGGLWRGISPPSGRHWRYSPEVLDELERNGLIEWSGNGVPRKIIYADDYTQKRMQDIWEFKDSQQLTYPTEKNIQLLSTIIKNSSHNDSLVFDCFCGSGTTLVAASMLNRKWIGIDKSELAIETTSKRLNNEMPLLSSYTYYEQVEEEKTTLKMKVRKNSIIAHAA
ncbi:MAG: site-specific DNA-methyltransferase [Ignavibacteriales bacterium]|nr:site-specific DNA-methyltransferase [Ignavibacteriales bacterium]